MRIFELKKIGLKNIMTLTDDEIKLIVQCLNKEHYKTENERLANKISELTIVLVRAVEDLNHLIEAKEIEKSIIKEITYNKRKMLKARLLD